MTMKTNRPDSGCTRTFTEFDWYGFAGSESWVPRSLGRFADEPFCAADCLPVIRELEAVAPGTYATVVADKNGVSIFFGHDDDGEIIDYVANILFPSNRLAIKLLDSLPADMTEMDAKLLGFKSC